MTHHSKDDGEMEEFVVTEENEIRSLERSRQRCAPCRIRGIRNRTGTACHLNAALIMIAYCFDEIPECISASENDEEEGEEVNNEEHSLRPALVSLLRQLRHSEEIDDAVDPTEFYAALSASNIELSPEQCGDAVVALIRWWQFIRNASGESVTPQVFDEILYSGRMHSVLHGVVLESSLDPNRSCRRRKVLKERTLMNPFPLPTFPRARMQMKNEEVRSSRFASLAEALQYAFLKEQPVEGYQWSNISTEEEGTVITSKRYYVTRLPPIWMIQLEGRCVHAPESTCEDGMRGDSIEIPSYFDGSEYISSSEDASSLPNVDGTLSNGVFHLRGGILHISHRNSDCGEKEDSVGHYVAVVSTTPNDVGPPQWYLVDDEIVISVSLEQVLSWMAGDWYSIDNSEEKDELYARGTLLVYHREDLADIVDSMSLFDKTVASFACTPTQEYSTFSRNVSQSKAFVRSGQSTSVFGDTSWDPGNDFSSIDNTTERRVGVPSPEQFCAQGVRRIDPETGQCVVTYEAPSSSNRASPVLQKSVEWRKNNYINKETASSVTLETHVGETNGSSSKRSSPLEENLPDDEQNWEGRRLRVLWSSGIYHEGRITQFDPITGKHTVVYNDGDIRQFHLFQKTFQWLDDEQDLSRSATPPSRAKFSSLWLDDSDVSDNDQDE